MSNYRLEAKRNRAIRPTKAQKEAFAKLVRLGGRQQLTKEDMLALSTMSALTASQRNEWAARAAAASPTGEHTHHATQTQNIHHPSQPL